jgi:hypothetical protein
MQNDPVRFPKYLFFTLNVRYLVDSKWFKQWKKYVGYESWDVDKAGMESMNPGPVDNSGLFTGMTILPLRREYGI